MVYILKKENLNNKTDFLIFSSYYFVIAAIIIFTFKFLIPILTPFLFGFLIAFFLRPISQKISKTTKLNKKFCNIFVIIFCYALIIFLLCVVGIKIGAKIKTLYSSSNEIYQNYLLPLCEFSNKNINNFLSNFFKYSEEQTQEFLNSIYSHLENLVSLNLKHILSWFAKIGTSIPEFLVNIAFSVISSIYFSYDYEKITKSITNLFPTKVQNFLFKTKGFTINTVIRYFKAYLFLMLISFILLAIGFFIIKLSNPIGTAAIVSFFDSIPLVGSGIILIPLAIIFFVNNNFNLAIGIIIIFLVTNIIRSVIEPKILGANLGLHPLSTLISIYIGAKLFGFIGIVAAPITTNILFLLYKSLNSEENMKSLDNR